jgi:hypothetical protein
MRKQYTVLEGASQNLCREYYFTVLISEPDLLVFCLRRRRRGREEWHEVTTVSMLSRGLGFFELALHHETGFC